MTEPNHPAPTVRRYSGSTKHADWCSDHHHDGYCLDVLLAKAEERTDG